MHALINSNHSVRVKLCCLGGAGLLLALGKLTSGGGWKTGGSLVNENSPRNFVYFFVV